MANVEMGHHEFVLVNNKTRVLPGGDLSVVILWWGLQDVDRHSVAGVVGEAKHLWAHQGVLNKRQLQTHTAVSGGRL